MNNSYYLTQSKENFFSFQSPADQSVSRAKEALIKNIISPKQSLQILSNIEAYREAVSIFKGRTASNL